jgi:hypothetical protein
MHVLTRKCNVWCVLDEFRCGLCATQEIAGTYRWHIRLPITNTSHDAHHVACTAASSLSSSSKTSVVFDCLRLAVASHTTKLHAAAASAGAAVIVMLLRSYRVTMQVQLCVLLLWHALQKLP